MASQLFLSRAQFEDIRVEDLRATDMPELRPDLGASLIRKKGVHGDECTLWYAGGYMRSVAEVHGTRWDVSVRGIRETQTPGVHGVHMQRDYPSGAQHHIIPGVHGDERVIRRADGSSERLWHTPYGVQRAQYPAPSDDAAGVGALDGADAGRRRAVPPTPRRGAPTRAPAPEATRRGRSRSRSVGAAPRSRSPTSRRSSAAV